MDGPRDLQVVVDSLDPLQAADGLLGHLLLIIARYGATQGDVAVSRLAVEPLTGQMRMLPKRRADVLVQSHCSRSACVTSTGVLRSCSHPAGVLLAVVIGALRGAW